MCVSTLGILVAVEVMEGSIFDYLNFTIDPPFSREIEIHLGFFLDVNQGVACLNCSEKDLASEFIRLIQIGCSWWVKNAISDIGALGER